MPLDRLPIKISAGLGLSMIDRSVKEMHATRCTRAELQTIRQYFQNNGGLKCIYCGSEEPTRWDHLHPVSRGGDTVTGNLVPACGRCDDSKQDREVEEWVQGTSPHRPAHAELARIQADILRYRGQFHYEPVEFEAKLSEEQKKTYREFQRELKVLRTHLQSAGLLR
jgi:hypothetical protein